MSGWQRLWRRAKMEDQLEKELRFHLEQHANELIAKGYPPAKLEDKRGSLSAAPNR